MHKLKTVINMESKSIHLLQSCRAAKHFDYYLDLPFMFGRLARPTYVSLQRLLRSAASSGLKQRLLLVY